MIASPLLFSWVVWLIQQVTVFDSHLNGREENEAVLLVAWSVFRPSVWNCDVANMTVWFNIYYAMTVIRWTDRSGLFLGDLFKHSPPYHLDKRYSRRNIRSGICAIKGFNSNRNVTSQVRGTPRQLSRRRLNGERLFVFPHTHNIWDKLTVGLDTRKTVWLPAATMQCGARCIWKIIIMKVANWVSDGVVVLVPTFPPPLAASIYYGIGAPDLCRIIDD